MFSLLLPNLSGCLEREGMAPVSEARGLLSNHTGTHRVQAGETLYAIAFRYDQDYRQLATQNQLVSPYTLRVGQILRVSQGRYSNHAPRISPVQPSRFYSATSQHSPQMIRRVPLQTNSQTVSQTPNYWAWPVQGHVYSSFIPAAGKKGIDIASKKGEGVYASAPGVVAYAGSGLLGYGNLIIIKHSNQYLTAYGNNSKNLVHEGQRIHAGQRIADVGVIDRRFWGVHFEIRRAGKPVNPLMYLGRKSS